MAGNSNSGRKKLPASIHLINGNKSKLSADELKALGETIVPKSNAPACPDFLSADAKAEWKRIASDLQTLGVLAKIDRSELSVYCQAWGDWKYARKKIAELGDGGFVETTPSGYKQISSWMQVANRAEDRMRSAGNAFGLNPAARSRLQIRPPQGELFPHEQKDAAEKYF